MQVPINIQHGNDMEIGAGYYFVAVTGLPKVTSLLN